MRFIRSLIITLLVGILFSSCTQTITYPLMSTDHKVGDKTGEAKVTKVFGVIGGGDIGVAKAARNGNIEKVSTVDLKVVQKPFVVDYITVVTGE